MNLYEIQKDWHSSIHNFLNCFDENWEALEWVNPEEAQALMSELENQRDEKIENILKYRANLLADSLWIDGEIQRLIKLRDSSAKKADRLENYLESILAIDGKDKKHSVGSWTMKWSKWTSTIIDDESLVPDEFKKEKTTISVDKTLIKEQLKEWKEVPWARLEQTYSFKVA